MRFLQIKITLKHTKPPIWRRVLVSAEITLEELHEVLQIAMGWTNSHMHQFETEEGIFADEASGLEETESSWNVTLASVLPRPKSSIRYEYDFGDGWDHQILLEKVVELEAPAPAVCLAGARACPPEDCGGPWGYANLLDALKDPKHPEHESMSDWIGPEFDPELFEIEAMNKQLARLGPARAPKKSAKKLAKRNI